MTLPATPASAGSPLDAMIRRIAAHATLEEADRHALADLPFTIETLRAGGYLVREGATPQHHAVLLDGFTQRHKLTSAGGRQIVGIQIPGEPASCAAPFFDRAEHHTQALTDVRVALIPRAAFRDLVRARPALAQALLLMALVEISVANEWLLNMGRRNARQRIAHLLCEVAARLDAAGLADGQRYDFPLTQEQIGDALGLTAVHVNRMLRELDEDGLVVRSGRRVTFPDRARIIREADFDGGYLRPEWSAAGSGT